MQALHEIWHFNLQRLVLITADLADLASSLTIILSFCGPITNQ